MKIFLLALAVIAASSSSCVVNPFRKPWVNVAIRNESSHNIDNARIRFGDYACRGGFVGKTYGKGYVGYPYPITEEAEVHWDVGGSPKKEVMDLRGIYGKRQSGTLTFTISDDGVKATFKEEPPP